MKRTLILSATLMAVAIPAMAADLPVKAPPPVMAPLPTWTGFYLGLNGGYSWGKSSRELNFVTATGATIIPPGGVVTTGGTDLEGGLFGGQIGYNWQTANWVLGFETDIQWANQRGSRAFTGVTPWQAGASSPGRSSTRSSNGSVRSAAAAASWSPRARCCMRPAVLPTGRSRPTSPWPA